MSDPVAEHYGSDGLVERIRAALRAAGFDLADLDADDLAGVDEFHLGGRAATEALLADLAPPPGSSVLDAGCGIGGAARVLARRGCSVLGVDLTPSFVETARALSAAVGLGDATRFEVGSALQLPVEDASADLATLLHVGMNIADKDALLAELARVVRPGGTVAVYDVMRVGEGDIQYPVPWASEASTSFVRRPDYVAAMEAAGLSPRSVTPRLELVLDVFSKAQAAPPPPVSLAHLMGPELPRMLGNVLPLLHGGVLAPVQVIARR